jgi:trimeric autotransporter adhesin
LRTSLAALGAVVLLAPGAPAATVGPLVALSAKTGDLQDFPRVSGQSVYAIEGDGAGGWFVGGGFSSAGGVACRNLVHISSNRTVDRSWCPKPDGTVRALSRVSGVLYVGGEGMHRIGGRPRQSLAALDIKGGQPLPWNPGEPGRTFGVFDLSPGRGVIYATGEFSRIGGKARRNLAAISLSNGRATRFAPNPDEDSHGDSAVGTVVASGSVYTWGIFSRAGGLPRDSFARLHPVTGRALVTEVSPICPTMLLPVGARLYAGTDTGCEGVKQPLSALALPRLERIAWRPALPRRHVEALVAAGDVLVAAAANNHFSLSEPRLIIGLDQAGHRAFTSSVRPRGPVQALAVGGGLVLVGVG